MTIMSGYLEKHEDVSIYDRFDIRYGFQPGKRFHLFTEPMGFLRSYEETNMLQCGQLPCPIIFDLKKILLELAPNPSPTFLEHWALSVSVLGKPAVFVLANGLEAGYVLRQVVNIPQGGGFEVYFERRTDSLGGYKVQGKLSLIGDLFSPPGCTSFLPFHPKLTPCFHQADGWNECQCVGKCFRDEVR